MKAIKVTIPEYGSGGYILSQEDSDSLKYEIEALFDYQEIGSKLQIELVEISKEDYQNLPEFSGW